MNIIFTRADSSLLFVARLDWRRALALAVAVVVVGWLAVRATAVSVVEEMLDDADPRLAQIVETHRKAFDSNRLRLWEGMINSAAADMAALSARLWRLENSGRRIAEQLQLPPDLFADKPQPASAEDSAANAGVNINNSNGNPAVNIHNAGERAAAFSAKLAAVDERMPALEGRYALLEIAAAARAARENTLPQMRPVRGRNWISSGYGYRKDPFSGRRAFHAGIDYAARIGTPVTAAADGIVIYRGRLGNYGRALELYHGRGASTLYGHLHKYEAELYQFVKRGDVIALIGNSGRSSGPHLHYEIRMNGRPTAPSRAIRALKKADKPQKS